MGESRRRRKIDIFQAEEMFLKQYIIELKKTFNYVCKIPIRYSKSQLSKYQMIFATNNKHGILLMADKMIACNNEMSLHINNGQPSLFDYEYRSGNCLNFVEELLPTCFTELKEFYYNIYNEKWFLYLTKDMNNAIKQLEENGKVEIRRTPAHTPTGKISRSMDYYKNTIKIRQK